MKKKFFSDFFFIQVINLLIKPVWLLVIDRKVQNTLPSESYGTYFSLTGFSLLFMILLDLGLTNFNNREVALDQSFYKKNFWSIMGTKAILTLVFIILASITGVWIGFTKYDFTIFGLLALNQCLLSFNTFFRSNISAIHHFKTDGILSVLDRLFVIISLGAILWTSFFPIPFNIYVFILAQTVGLIITFIISWWSNLKYLGKADFIFDKIAMQGLLKKSLPYALIIALMTFYTRLDSVLILKMLPDGRLQAGNYAMSYRLLDAAAIIGILLAGQLMPLFVANLKDKIQLRVIIRWAALIVFVPSILGTLFCSYYGHGIIELFYPEKYSFESGKVFTLLIWCLPGMILINIFGALLTAAGKVKRINQIAFAACLINGLGNWIFLEEYGLVAAAIIAVITQGFFGLMCLINSRTLIQQTA